MKSIYRWLVVTALGVCLIEWPRGISLTGPDREVVSPITHFTRAQFAHNLSDLWHRLVTLNPGLTVDGSQSLSVAVTSGLGGSLVLIGFGLSIVFIFGIAKGIYDGLHTARTTFLSRVSATVQWVAESLPDFFLITLLLYLEFFLNHHGIQVYFIGSDQFLGSTLVPALLVSILPTMYMIRVVRMAVEQQFGQQYLVTARAKGLTRKRIVLRHVLPNCIPAVLSSLTSVIGMLIANLLMIEYLFGRQGIVSTLFKAMGQWGFREAYHPVGDPARTFDYYAYDPQLTLASLLACFALLLGCAWLMTQIVGLLGYRRRYNPYTSQLHDNAVSRAPWQLILGMTIFATLVFLGLIANRLPLPVPDKGEVIQMSGDSISVPPFPPSWQHLLGTDVSGRDLLSRTLHGIIPTFEYVSVIVIAVILIGLILSVTSSVWKIPGVRFAVDTWHSLFNFVPSTIAALLILDIPDIYWYGVHIRRDHITWSTVHIFIYLSVIGLLETGRAAHFLQSLLDDAENKVFMESAAIAGNSKFTRFVVHILGPLRDGTIELFVSQFNRTLLLLATLGFFQYPVIEEFHAIMEGFSLKWVHASASLDWSSLMSENARDFLAYGWVLLAPTLFVATTVVSLSLIHTGLRLRARSSATGMRSGLSWRMNALAFLLTKRGVPRRRDTAQNFYRRS